MGKLLHSHSPSLLAKGAVSGLPSLWARGTGSLTSLTALASWMLR